jgi:putative transposase
MYIVGLSIAAKIQIDYISPECRRGKELLPTASDRRNFKRRLKGHGACLMRHQEVHDAKGMKYNPKLYQRRSIRLREYDYSMPGGYFVTICTDDDRCILGKIVEEEMRLNEMGKIVAQCWHEIPNHFPCVELDAFVAMPNHIHGIIVIKDDGSGIQLNGHKDLVGVENFQPLQKKFQHVTPKSLGSIIRSYKAAVTRECRVRNCRGFRWQRNYYDHIIRDDKDLDNIREYIANNVLQWILDKDNPENLQL